MIEPIFVPSPYFRVGRAGHRPLGIIIHITENDTLTGLDRWFQKNDRGVSAHYGIGRSGEIHQYVDEDNVAWHASLGGNPTWRLIKPGISPSFYTIGIEHVGKGTEPWEEEKYRASAALVKEICSRWDIPIDRDHIIRHDEVSSTECPGSQVDLERIIDLARSMPEQEYNLVEESGIVRTVIDLNLRHSPTTLANVVRVIPAGTDVPFTGWVTNGLRVARNPNWYIDAAGNYFWAGGTAEPNPDQAVHDPAVSSGTTTSPLHLRKGPGIHFAVLRVLPFGAPVQILAEHGNWLRVVAEGQEGFVHKNYVRLDGSEHSEPVRTGRTIARLNLRTGPGTNFPSLRVMPLDTDVVIMGEEGKWWHIIVDEQEGYAHKEFVDIGGHSILSGYIRPDSATPGGTLLRDVPLAPHQSEQINSSHAVAVTWNRLGGLISVLANMLDIDPVAALAVWMVESAGKAFVNGRMTIRFENHVFYRYWGQHHQQLFNQHFSYNQHTSWQGHKWRAAANQPWQDVHGSQAKEWRAFDFARTLDEIAAMNSISMGGPQIMGFNHSRIGYETVRNMFDDLSNDERYHVLGFFNFVKGVGTSSEMVRALRVQDFNRFSEIYNGSLATTHASRMREYYNLFDSLRSP